LRSFLKNFKIFANNIEGIKMQFNEIKRKMLYISIVILTSLLTFLTAYWYPSGLFWDENYHIASSQKYIDGVFFMEPHPPLGKQIIALGEAIFNFFGVNKGIDKSSFNTTDYINSVPEGYSFAGVRFFPTLFGALSSIFVFLIFYHIFSNLNYALLFSSFYVFENSIIMHSRGAMLEGIQLFFVLWALFYFFKIINQKRTLLNYFNLGLITSLAIAVKVNSAILLLLFVFLAWEDYSKNLKNLNFSFSWIKEFLLKVLVSITGVLIPLLISFYFHFAICQNVLENRYYNASNKYREILSLKQAGNPVHFFTMLKDYIGYIERYEKGVPKWDPSKVGENGSPAFTWPFGYKAINYRWTKWRGKVAYLYLQGNPLLWLCGLIGVLLSFSLVTGRIFFNSKYHDEKNFKYIVYLSIMYFSYMLAMMKIERVMYLYHYFIPLLFSFFLFALIFYELFYDYIKDEDKLMLMFTSFFVVEIFLVFLFFSPFTYYIPLDNIQFMKRVWTKIWGLVPVTY